MIKKLDYPDIIDPDSLNLKKVTGKSMDLRRSTKNGENQNKVKKRKKYSW
jgi:hypothetical protein